MLPEIVADMTLRKGCYTTGQVYVAFSRVTQLDKLHIINDAQSQIHVSENVEQVMEHMSCYKLPDMPTPLINQLTDYFITCSPQCCKHEEETSGHLCRCCYKKRLTFCHSM